MLFSERADTTVVRDNATNDDISNANNNLENAPNPVEERDPENKSAGNNNNWWGSWINSAKTKVTSVKHIHSILLLQCYIQGECVKVMHFCLQFSGHFYLLFH